ncbi:MAG: amidohydrolase family protein, partial [Clostridia bacterium]|nr:amidohydrolase family protein [Clostridia bacterium]
PLPTAVGYASLNPARNIGVAAERGSIEVGKRADFALLTDDFETVATVVSGRVVYRA